MVYLGESDSCRVVLGLGSDKKPGKSTTAVTYPVREQGGLLRSTPLCFLGKFLLLSVSLCYLGVINHGLVWVIYRQPPYPGGGGVIIPNLLYALWAAGAGPAGGVGGRLKEGLNACTK